MQVVIFKILDEQFAVETEKIKSINDMMEVTAVPKAPEYIKGLINLRGNVSSLLDANLLLGLEESKEQSSIIILNLQEESVGISVDEVSEVLDIEENLIEKTEELKEKPYLKGVINFKDRIVTLIDINKMIPNY
ncbi:chemotaxis protein CheW [Clostridiaceae bacterium 14S0207]|nr:chemotaxis protein CheW [Clostridiaceae bacterium 14S0207]